MTNDTTRAMPAVEEIQLMADELEQTRQAATDGWLPIDAAPKDGSHFLAFAQGYQYVMRHGSFGFHLITTPSTILPPYKPTHWMPLPADPTYNGKKEG